MKTCEIADEVSSAQTAVLEKYSEIARNIGLLRKQNDELVRSLMGTGLYHASIRSIIIQRITYQFIGVFFPNLALKHTEIKRYLKTILSIK